MYLWTRGSDLMITFLLSSLSIYFTSFVQIWAVWRPEKCMQMHYTATPAIFEPDITQ